MSDINDSNIQNTEELKFPLYLTNEDSSRMFSVINFIDRKVVFEDGKGYIDPETGNIFIFSKSEPKASKIPYFWYEKGLLKFNSPRPQYHKNNLVNYSYDVILKNTRVGEQLYDEKAIADMNDAASIYVPIINDDDDFLKIVVKTIIKEKGIDINRLKSKLQTKYALTNMKSALITKTKMSVVNFRMWMELLGCDFEITVKDDGSDHIDPLKDDIHYSSLTNKAE